MSGSVSLAWVLSEMQRVAFSLIAFVGVCMCVRACVRVCAAKTFETSSKTRLRQVCSLFVGASK